MFFQPSFPCENETDGLISTSSSGTDGVPPHPVQGENGALRRKSVGNGNDAEEKEKVETERSPNLSLPNTSSVGSTQSFYRHHRSCLSLLQHLRREFSSLPRSSSPSLEGSPASPTAASPPPLSSSSPSLQPVSMVGVRSSEPRLCIDATSTTSTLWATPTRSTTTPKETKGLHRTQYPPYRYSNAQRNHRGGAVDIKGEDTPNMLRWTTAPPLPAGLLSGRTLEWSEEEEATHETAAFVGTEKASAQGQHDGVVSHAKRQGEAQETHTRVPVLHRGEGGSTVELPTQWPDMESRPTRQSESVTPIRMETNTKELSATTSVSSAVRMSTTDLSTSSHVLSMEGQETVKHTVSTVPPVMSLSRAPVKITSTPLSTSKPPHKWKMPESPVSLLRSGRESNSSPIIEKDEKRSAILSAWISSGPSIADEERPSGDGEKEKVSTPLSSSFFSSREDSGAPAREVRWQTSSHPMETTTVGSRTLDARDPGCSAYFGVASIVHDIPTKAAEDEEEKRTTRVAEETEMRGSTPALEPARQEDATGGDMTRTSWAQGRREVEVTHTVLPTMPVLKTAKKALPSPREGASQTRRDEEEKSVEMRTPQGPRSLWTPTATAPSFSSPVSALPSSPEVVRYLTPTEKYRDANDTEKARESTEEENLAPPLQPLRFGSHPERMEKKEGMKSVISSTCDTGRQPKGKKEGSSSPRGTATTTTRLSPLYQSSTSPVFLSSLTRRSPLQLRRLLPGEAHTYAMPSSSYSGVNVRVGKDLQPALSSPFPSTSSRSFATREKRSFSTPRAHTKQGMGVSSSRGREDIHEGKRTRKTEGVTEDHTEMDCSHYHPSPTKGRTEEGVGEFNAIPQKQGREDLFSSISEEPPYGEHYPHSVPLYRNEENKENTRETIADPSSLSCLPSSCGIHRSTTVQHHVEEAAQERGHLSAPAVQQRVSPLPSSRPRKAGSWEEGLSLCDSEEEKEAAPPSSLFPEEKHHNIVQDTASHPNQKASSRERLPFFVAKVTSTRRTTRTTHKSRSRLPEKGSLKENAKHHTTTTLPSSLKQGSHAEKTPTRVRWKAKEHLPPPPQPRKKPPATAEEMTQTEEEKREVVGVAPQEPLHPSTPVTTIIRSAIFSVPQDAVSHGAPSRDKYGKEEGAVTMLTEANSSRPRYLEQAVEARARCLYEATQHLQDVFREALQHYPPLVWVEEPSAIAIEGVHGAVHPTEKETRTGRYSKLVWKEEDAFREHSGQGGQQLRRAVEWQLLLEHLMEVSPVWWHATETVRAEKTEPPPSSSVPPLSEILRRLFQICHIVQDAEHAFSRAIAHLIETLSVKALQHMNASEYSLALTLLQRGETLTEKGAGCGLLVYPSSSVLQEEEERRERNGFYEAREGVPFPRQLTSKTQRTTTMTNEEEEEVMPCVTLSPPEIPRSHACASMTLLRVKGLPSRTEKGTVGRAIAAARGHQKDELMERMGSEEKRREWEGDDRTATTLGGATFVLPKAMNTTRAEDTAYTAPLHTPVVRYPYSSSSPSSPVIFFPFFPSDVRWRRPPAKWANASVSTSTPTAARTTHAVPLSSPKSPESSGTSSQAMHTTPIEDEMVSATPSPLSSSSPSSVPPLLLSLPWPQPQPFSTPTRSSTSPEAMVLGPFCRERYRLRAIVANNRGLYHFTLGEYRTAIAYLSRAAALEERLQQNARCTHGEEGTEIETRRHRLEEMASSRRGRIGSLLGGTDHMHHKGSDDRTGRQSDPSSVLWSTPLASPSSPTPSFSSSSLGKTYFNLAQAERALYGQWRQAHEYVRNRERGPYEALREEEADRAGSAHRQRGWKRGEPEKEVEGTGVSRGKHASPSPPVGHGGIAYPLLILEKRRKQQKATDEVESWRTAAYHHIVLAEDALEEAAYTSKCQWNAAKHRHTTSYGIGAPSSSSFSSSVGLEERKTATQKEITSRRDPLLLQEGIRMTNQVRAPSSDGLAPVAGERPHTLLQQWMTWREAVAFLSYTTQQHGVWLAQDHEYAAALAQLERSSHWMRCIEKWSREEQERMEVLRRSTVECRKALRQHSGTQEAHRRGGGRQPTTTSSFPFSLLPPPPLGLGVTRTTTRADVRDDERVPHSYLLGAAPKARKNIRSGYGVTSSGHGKGGRGVPLWQKALGRCGHSSSGKRERGHGVPSPTTSVKHRKGIPTSLFHGMKVGTTVLPRHVEVVDFALEKGTFTTDTPKCSYRTSPLLLEGPWGPSVQVRSPYLLTEGREGEKQKRKREGAAGSRSKDAARKEKRNVLHTDREEEVDAISSSLEKEKPRSSSSSSHHSWARSTKSTSSSRCACRRRRSSSDLQEIEAAKKETYEEKHMEEQEEEETSPNEVPANSLIFLMPSDTCTIDLSLTAHTIPLPAPQVSDFSPVAWNTESNTMDVQDAISKEEECTKNKEESISYSSSAALLPVTATVAEDPSSVPWHTWRETTPSEAEPTEEKKNTTLDAVHNEEKGRPEEEEEHHLDAIKSAAQEEPLGTRLEDEGIVKWEKMKEIKKETSQEEQGEEALQDMEDKASSTLTTTSNSPLRRHTNSPSGDPVCTPIAVRTTTTMDHDTTLPSATHTPQRSNDPETGKKQMKHIGTLSHEEEEEKTKGTPDEEGNEEESYLSVLPHSQPLPIIAIPSFSLSTTSSKPTPHIPKHHEKPFSWRRGPGSILQAIEVIQAALHGKRSTDIVRAAMWDTPPPHEKQEKEESEKVNPKVVPTLLAISEVPLHAEDSDHGAQPSLCIHRNGSSMSGLETPSNSFEAALMQMSCSSSAYEAQLFSVEVTLKVDGNRERAFLSPWQSAGQDTTHQ